MAQYEKFTAEQERAFIKAIQDNGGKPTEQQQERLVSAYLPFIRNVAYNCGIKDKLQPEELLGAGWCGMIKALETFDLGSNTRFLSYAVWWIRAYINKEREAIKAGCGGVKASNGGVKAVSLETPLVQWDLKGATLHDVIADPKSGSPFEQIINNSTIDGFKDFLTDKQFKALVYGSRLNGSVGGFKGAAYVMGISSERVRQLKADAIKLIKERLKKTGEIESDK